MNFLAHIYLSGNDDSLKIGNFIADSIRGNKYLNYPEEIQKGIILHRHIDTFTDSHPIVKISKKRLYKNYSHYSSVIVDIYYDHFLAKNWSDYSTEPLESYVNQFYELLKHEFDMLPTPVKKMYPHMVNDNWLNSYATIEGITKVLEGMNHRTKNKSKMNLAVNELQEFYLDFEKEFTDFFKELMLFVEQELKNKHFKL
ncbi:MAG: ACP phosphodiesterase [Flavobacteriaceae bacterium]